MAMSKDQLFGSSTARVSKKMTRMINFYLKPHQITAEQWSVLRSLNAEDHISQKELAKRTDKDQATLTKILDLLEKNGFIQRLHNPLDRRSYLVQITDKGKQLTNQVAPIIEHVFSQILYGISQEKLMMFVRILADIEKNLDKHIKEILE
jgi:DNA-binding MarR family transcriptional regulator